MAHLLVYRCDILVTLLETRKPEALCFHTVIWQFHVHPPELSTGKRRLPTTRFTMLSQHGKVEVVKCENPKRKYEIMLGIGCSTHP